MNNIAVLIPAYKPEGALVSVARNLLDFGFRHVLVIDDGSGPDFEPVFDAISQLAGVSVYRHARNLGKGAALKTGFNYALVNWPDVQAIVTADADGQHAPEDILRVAQASVTNPGSLVIGARTFYKEIPFRSLFGNSLTRLVFRVFTGLNVKDTQTGLRAWPKALCLEALKIDLNGYDFEMESLVQAKQHMGKGLKIVEVPIRTIYEDGNRSSHFNPILDSMRIYFVFMRYSGAAITNAVVDNVIFMLLYHQTHSIGFSQLMGRSAATVLAFILMRNVVFHSSAKWTTSLIKFIALVIATGGVSYGVINFLHAEFGFNVIPAKLLTEGVLFLGNFALQRDLIFSKTVDDVPAGQSLKL